ncbi:uncharacterized protein LOC117240219 [Bombus vosnesenskii]|uniref:Uncharacterized protein LOC117240219 n=1 Tax=Bombus vosnesenskii TaxID=207650 RepID=A0A6J3L9R3_9HYME|nr:uncharacterized protein LOC117240219 [Bombus vosnesenskii]
MFARATRIIPLLSHNKDVLFRVVLRFGNRRSNYVCGVISIRGSYPDFPAQAKEGFRRTHGRLGKTHQTHCGPVMNHKYQSGWRNYSTLVPRPWISLGIEP